MRIPTPDSRRAGV